MRPLLLYIFSIFLFVKAPSQSAVNMGVGPLMPMSSSLLTEITAREWQYSLSETGATWDNQENVTGTQFFTEDYNSGYILLDGNKLAKDVPIRYNVYTSQLYFKKDSQVMVMDAAVPIAEFGYWNNSMGQATVFRRGYPDIANNTTKTYYEVLEFGKLTLLEQHSKRVVEKRDIHGVPQKIISDIEAWFVYDATAGKMVEIKHNKSSLLEALPGYSDAIQSTIQGKKLKLKSDADWSILFKQLNGKS